MTPRRRRPTPVLAVVLAAALGAGLAGCSGGNDSGNQRAAQEVKFGLLTPLKGPSAAAGQEAQRGAQLAADVIDGQNPSIPLPLAEQAGLPGLGGARVKIVPRDTSSDNQVAADAASRLVTEDGVSAITGAFDPAVTSFASQRTDRLGVPFVTADSPSSFLTRRGLDWFYRLGPSVRVAGRSFFSLLQDKISRNATTVVVHVFDAAGNDVAATIKELAAEGGFRKPEDISFPADASDLGSTVDQIRALNPDTVFVYASPETVQPVIAAFASRQYRPRAVMSFGLGYLNASAYRSNAQVVTGLCRSVSWSPEPAGRNPAARAVSNLYQRKYNTPMTEAAAASFTAVMTLAQAVDAARSVRPNDLRTALLGLDIPGDDTIMPWSGIRFDETRENIGAQAVVEQFVNQSFRVVFPTDAKSIDMKYPANT
jgi:branched-chain amino acid transport system substrate-binding protein